MGYELETSEFLPLSLFYNVSKTTLFYVAIPTDSLMKISRN